MIFWHNVTGTTFFNVLLLFAVYILPLSHTSAFSLIFTMAMAALISRMLSKT